MEIAFLFILSIVLLCLIGAKNSSSTNNKGEKLVQNALKKYCQGQEAHLLNNITLKLDNGSTTQIDHILISNRGVFVIETKHYSGWIFASTQSKVWSQILFKSKHFFQNPIRQNYLHLKSVQKLLSFLPKNVIHNIVVFTGSAKFKTNLPENVCYFRNLTAEIERRQRNQLSLKHIQYCVGIIEYHRLEISNETDVEHQDNLWRRLSLHQ